MHVYLIDEAHTDTSSLYEHDWAVLPRVEVAFRVHQTQPHEVGAWALRRKVPLVMKSYS